MTLDSVLRCRFLGHAQIEIAHTLITPEAERLFALLAVLATEAGVSHHRDDLTRLLWSDQPEERGKHNLRQTLYKARQLGAQLETSGEEVRLPPSAVWCDWQQSDTPVHGEWLGAYTGSFSDPFASWVVSTRVLVHTTLRPRLVAAMQAARASGDLRQAEQHASQLLRVDPLNEEATLVLAECVAMAGAKVDALRLLDAYATEVGEGREMADAVLPARVLRTRIAERLPVATYATGEAHDLPLVGREAELKQLLASLFDVRGGRGGVTWVWGPSGIGKSRLVHEVLKAAAMQGVRVARDGGGGAGDIVSPWRGLKSITEKLMNMPGALGTTPEALQLVRDFSSTSPSNDHPHTNCEIVAAIADLIASVSHEQPVLIVVDSADPWGAQETGVLIEAMTRCAGCYAGLIVTTRLRPKPTALAEYSLPTRVVGVGRMLDEQLQQLLEKRLITQGFTEAQTRALGPARAAEGNPRFAIELLGQSMNAADPDSIPFVVRQYLSGRVRVLSTAGKQILCAAWAHQHNASRDFLARCTRLDTREVDRELSILLDDHLIVQAGNGYSVSALLDSAHEEVVNFVPDQALLLECAEQLRTELALGGKCAVFFRALLLLCLTGHSARAAEWASEDIEQVLMRSSAPEILAGIKQIEDIVKLEGPLKAVARIRDEIRLRATVNRATLASPSEPRAQNEYTRIKSVLPNILPEEAKFTEFSLRTAEYESSIDKARDNNIAASERVRAACHAIVLADNLRNASLSAEASAVLEAVAVLPGSRALDVARGRLISICSMQEWNRLDTACEELATIAREVPDKADACKALRNAAQAMASVGRLERAREYCSEALRLAEAHGYAAQAARGLVNLGFISTSLGDFQAARELLAQTTKVLRSHGVEFRDIEFDSILLDALLNALSGNLPAVARAVPKLTSWATATDSPLVHRQIAALAQVASRKSSKGVVIADVEALARALNIERPDDYEDRISVLLLLAVQGHERSSETGRLIRTYIEKKKRRGLGVSPYLTALIDSTDGGKSS